MYLRMPRVGAFSLKTFMEDDPFNFSFNITNIAKGIGRIQILDISIGFWVDLLNLRSKYEDTEVVLL